MFELILENEQNLRLGFFVGILLVMALWETLNPKRPWKLKRGFHWLNNLGLVIFNTALLRILFPAAAVGMAVLAEQKGWGLLGLWDMPFTIKVIVSIVFLDFMIWLQHVVVHAIPALWMLHRVHHADLDYDVTTGLRFHPLEIILSMLIKFAVIIFLGPPVVAVILFEIILNGMAMFNHGNVSLPKALEKPVRWLLVTPDMHRVHHSVQDDETNSNFGFNLSIWDRLFGTYKAQPDAGQEGMTIGIEGFNQPDDVAKISGMLTLPFKGRSKDYAINRRSWK